MLVYSALSFFNGNGRMTLMIHHSSTDPVLIKKISLKVWTLRDEVESRVQDKIAALGSEIENQNIDISDIKKTYTPKSADAEVIALNPSAALDKNEDEMTKAMAEVDSGSSEETSEPTAETTADAVITPLFNEANSPSNLIEISSDVPNLSPDKLHKGKTVLAEIGMDKIFFFSNKKFTEGQSIVIRFEIPKTFIMNADVIYCRPFNLKSRVISENNYQFRIMAKFTFLKEGERALLRQFLKSVEPEIETAPAPNESAKTEKEGDSDFSELDDLI